MKNPDTRVRYTKSAFHAAMLSLLEEKPYTQVTVRELCDKAELNRGTFYLHYKTPYDLLKEIENDFIAKNMALFSSYWDRDRDINFMELIFGAIWQNRAICRILMGGHGDPQFLSSLKQLVRQGIIDEWQKEIPDCPQSELDFIYEYTFSGSTQLILTWLDDDCKMPVPEFVHRLERLGHYNLVAAREFSKRTVDHAD